jgi:hypothetical protein
MTPYEQQIHRERELIFLREHMAHRTGLGSFIATGPIGPPREAPEPVRAPITTNPDPGDGSKA